MNLMPLKVRADINPLHVALEIFGSPIRKSINWGPVGGEECWGWSLVEEGLQTELELEWTEGRRLSINISTAASWHLPYARYEEPPRTTLKKLEDFARSIRKPWEEWNEEEVMEEPMWVCLRMEETGTTTPESHTMMVMESYKNPDDQWVKRYFRNSPEKIAAWR